jgi:superfamily II helicase
VSRLAILWVYVGWRRPDRPGPSAVAGGVAPRRFSRPGTDDGVVAITDKVYVKNHRQLVSQLETSFPKGAFKGATLDILYQGEGLSKLDEATRDRVLDFAEDFLDCDCESNPHCGCAERKFIRYLLELREQGMGPEAIVDVMGDDYMLYAYPGDVRGFLDDSIRTLEAVASLADVDGQNEAADAAIEKRDELVR